MVSIGIDAVEIERFNTWAHFSKEKLARVFSDQEIAYCLSIPAKSAERFAVRFSAKEAFFKALGHPLPFLTVCKHCEVIKDSGSGPLLRINWNGLGSEARMASISLTHTKTTALAVVLLD